MKEPHVSLGHYRTVRAGLAAGCEANSRLIFSHSDQICLDHQATVQVASCVFTCSQSDAYMFTGKKIRERNHVDASLLLCPALILCVLTSVRSHLSTLCIGAASSVCPLFLVCCACYQTVPSHN